MHGHIICRSDGKTLTFETQHMVPFVDLAEDKTESDDSEYVGNRNTKKFHYAECSSVSDMKDNNKVFLTIVMMQLVKDLRHAKDVIRKLNVAARQ